MVIMLRKENLFDREINYISPLQEQIWFTTKTRPIFVTEILTLDPSERLEDCVITHPSGQMGVT